MGDESQFGSVCKTMDATTLLSRAEDLCFGGMVPHCAVVSGTPVRPRCYQSEAACWAASAPRAIPKGEAATLAVIGIVKKIQALVALH